MSPSLLLVAIAALAIVATPAFAAGDFFEGDYTVKFADDSKGSVSGTIQYSWNLGAMKLVYGGDSQQLVTDYYEYVVAESQPTSVTCESRFDPGCMNNYTIESTPTEDNTMSVTLYPPPKSCKLSHWVIPIPDCVDPSQIQIEGGTQYEYEVRQDPCGIFSGVPFYDSSNGALKIQASEGGDLKYTITMPGSIVTEGWVGLKGGVDCSACKTFSFGCAQDHPGKWGVRVTDTCGGCERSEIGGHQARFFYDGSYYNAPSGPQLNGCNHVTAKDANTNEVKELWYNPTTNFPCQALMANGDLFVFSNLRSYTGQIEAPTTCRCYKPIDVVVGLDLGKLSTADFKLQRDFVERFVDQFSISSEYVNMGVFTVGASVKVGVEVKQGNIRSNVISGIRTLTCESSGETCSTSEGSIAAATSEAANQLAAGRGFAKKVFVLLTNGASDTTTAVTSARAKLPADTDVIVVKVGERFTSASNELVAALKPTHTIAVVDSYEIKFDHLDVSAAVCAANDQPCGAGCCGACTCGTCVPPTCGTESECGGSVLVGGCCKESSTVTDCPDNRATCTNTECVGNQCQSGDSMCPPPNACYTYTCDGTGGCTPSFLGNTDDKCAEQYCDVSSGTPVLKTKSLNCNGTDPCYTYSCSNSQCVATRLTTTACAIPDCTTNADCPAPACFDAVCLSNGKCSTTTRVCDDGDSCTTDVCDTATNQCVSTTIVCDDLFECTKDVCVNGVCQFTPNTCDDSNACTVNECNPVDGTCSSVAKDCDDGNLCTEDVCDAVTGQCKSTSIVCNDDNACTVDECDPFVGCKYVPIQCEPADEDACELNFCDAELAAEDPSLTGQALCNKKALECKDDVGVPVAVVATAAVLGAGVIIGIVIAIVVVLGGIGGGAYAVARNINSNSVASVTNNPLYEGSGNAGSNPLYRS